MKHLQKNSLFYLLIAFIAATFWIWWIPGKRVGNDFSYISNDWLRLQFNLPQAWSERGSEGLGGNVAFLLWSWPQNIIIGLIAQIGLNFEIWERLLIILYIFIGSFSIWAFLKQFNLSNTAIFLGSIFYLLSTYALLVIDGGQISISLAYALFPLAITAFEKGINANLRQRIISGLLVTSVGIFDIRFVFVFAVWALFRFIFCMLMSGSKFSLFKSWFKVGASSIGIVLGLNLFWLVAQIMTPVASNIFESLTKITTLSDFNIGHVLLLLSPHWFKNVFGEISPLRWEFILIPLLAMCAPILKTKDKNIAFWLLMLCISVFLAKGYSQPFIPVYSWIYSNIPGFTLFRDSTKFFFLVALSYTVLVSTTLDQIITRIKSFPKIAAFSLIISSYLLFLIYPVFTNQMHGTFSFPALEKDYEIVNHKIQSEHAFGRTFWIPATQPLTYSDLNHPTIEAVTIFNRYPFINGVKGTYEIYNFLREAPYMGEVFDISGISYIIYPPLDPNSKNSLHPDTINYYHTFLNQLKNLPWIEKPCLECLNIQPTVAILKTKQHQDKFFLTAHSWIVVGSDSLLNEATKSAQLALNKNSLFFTEQTTGTQNLYDKLPESGIILNNKTETDLAASLIPENSFLFPAKSLHNDPDRGGWWKRDSGDRIAFRSFLREKYGIDSSDFDYARGWAIAENSSEFTLQNSQFGRDKVLLARIFESSRSGEINFFQDDKTVGKVKTKNLQDNLRWFEVGTLSSGDNLDIKTQGEINIINALAVLDQSEWNSLKDRAYQLAPRVKKYSSNPEAETFATINYQMLTPTKYRVNISGLNKPQILVFSETYNKGWKIGGQKSIPAYGFLNSFRIERDGDYILEFEPQKYIYYGFAASSLVAAIIILALLYSFWAKKKS